MARDNIDWLPESGTERRIAPPSANNNRPANDNRPTSDRRATADNRTAKRFAYRALARAVIHPAPSIGGETQHCYVPTRDISQTGISFVHPKKLDIGQRIELAFQDNRQVEVKVQRF